MPNVTRTEAIKNFLTKMTLPDLAALYKFDMECQVNVAQEGGQRVTDEYKGKRWSGWTDGLVTWKPFRIPYNASKEPTYTDVPMAYPLDRYAEGIGMTGWDWVNKVSRWVAFDFDGIVGHSEKHAHKLSPAELEEIQHAVHDVPWVTLRRSTSGHGLHIYVFTPDVPTATHTEHAALARSILGVLSARTGHNLSAKVDACGGNMWVWHRKMIGTNGLELLKSGTVIDEIPYNWREHEAVIRGSRKKAKPLFVIDDKLDEFDELCGQYNRVKLDDVHRKLLEYLETANAQAWWDNDHNMLVAHTYDLKKAFATGNFIGYFDTLATGREQGHDHNCFLFPLRNGAWVVRRFSPGIQEASCWDQDSSGWTRTWFNRTPTFDIACRATGGVEAPNGSFIFKDGEAAEKAAQLLGSTLGLEKELSILGREYSLKQNKDGKIVASTEARSNDNFSNMPKWVQQKKTWATVINYSNASNGDAEATANFDDMVRHIIANNSDAGWVIRRGESWIDEPRENIKDFLRTCGVDGKELPAVMGQCVMHSWNLVVRPFQPEYPGDREWNRGAAQFRFTPTLDRDALSYPTWSKILDHCGRGLDPHLENNEWCRSNNILKGGDYLKCWVASMFQNPHEPLPYLFFWGNQNCGKSSFQEALQLLLTTGHEYAMNALTNPQGFNGELANAIIAVVEELDLNKSRTAYDRVKSWVTGREIPIHVKGCTPYKLPNYLHWIHCANHREYCPIFKGDTRITMLHVPDITDFVGKRQLEQELIKQAPDFLAEILELEVPECTGERFLIPVIETPDKDEAMETSGGELDEFLSDYCEMQDGYVIPCGEFAQRFQDAYNRRLSYSEKTMITAFGSIVRGRINDGGTWCYGNVRWKTGTSRKYADGVLVRKDDMLKVV